MTPVYLFDWANIFMVIFDRNLGLKYEYESVF